MKTYLYNSYPEEGLLEITEDEIIKEYFPFWSSKLKEQDKDHLISRENCIDDWCIVHWAWEKT